MTEKCNAGHEVSRREFMVAAGAAAAVGGAIGTTATPAAAAVAANEICRMDAVTLADKIRTKQLSPTEVTEAVLARMEKLNPVLGAFCTPSPDVARAQANAIEADIMAGKSVGPLAGVPVGIKDLVYTKGIKTTSGSIIYKDFVPTEDDVVVERLKAAGAVIIGKTNVPELGYSGASFNLIFPPTKNPWNTDRTAGGSSAGSGAAVAAGPLQHENAGAGASGFEGGATARDAEASDYNVVALGVLRQCLRRDGCRSGRRRRRRYAEVVAKPDENRMIVVLAEGDACCRTPEHRWRRGHSLHLAIIRAVSGRP